MNKDYFKTTKPVLEEENEKEYDVKVSACFSVMAIGRKEAEEYIIKQIHSGNTTYVEGIEIDF